MRLITAIGLLGLASSALTGCDVIDFAPDGKKLTLSIGTDTIRRSLAIWEPGINLVSRIDGTDGGASPSWSADGWKVAYLQKHPAPSDPSAGYSLMVTDLRTARTRKLADGALGPFAWREDGKRLACVMRGDAGQLEAAQWDAVAGGQINHFALPFTEASGGRIIWLPGTDNIALLGRSASGVDVYSVEDGETNQITKTGDVLGLDLSADRKNLVWARPSKNPKYILLNLYAFDLAKRSVAKLPFPDRVPGINPDPRTGPAKVLQCAVSPDGRQLLLASEWSAAAKAGTPPTSQQRVHLIAIDGSASKQVRSVPTGFSIGLQWSPTSKQFTVSLASGPKALYELYASDGSKTAAVGEDGQVK